MNTRIGVRRDGRLIALVCQPVDGSGASVMNFANGDPDDLRCLLPHTLGLHNDSDTGGSSRYDGTRRRGFSGQEIDL